MDPRFSQAISTQRAEQEIYDVIVVGAGPAGATAAYHLGIQGVRVLLVDRETFPRDKACGDAVMPPAMEELALMGLAETISSRFPPLSQVRSVHLLPSLHNQLQKLVPSGSQAYGYVIPRVEFDALLCSHALHHAGCAWLDRVEIRNIIATEQSDTGYAALHGVRQEADDQLVPVLLRARMVIIADGSRSLLVRQLRAELQQSGDPNGICTKPADDYERFTARSSYYSGIDLQEGTIEFFFSDLGLHYFWVFPMRDGIANVGATTVHALSRSHKFTTTMLEQLLDTHLGERSLNATRISNWRSAPLRAGLRETALYGHRRLCVGDAAALVDPFADEGISAALWSGRCAAEHTLQALSSGTFTSAALRPYGEAVTQRYEAKYQRNLLQVRMMALIQETMTTAPTP